MLARMITLASPLVSDAQPSARPAPTTRTALRQLVRVRRALRHARVILTWLTVGFVCAAAIDATVCALA
jgi:hypothetical protein